MRVVSGGSAIWTEINGGVLSVDWGGKTEQTYIRSGGIERVKERATSSLIESGGSLIVFSGGTAISPCVLSGGELIVSSGGAALNVASQAGAIISVAEGADITYA